MARSKSSAQWLHEHVNDVFVKKAQAEGYRSRAVYKLKEIDEKEHLFKPGLTVVDLGAAPGGWSQYVVKKMQGVGTLVALDLLPMIPINQVQFIQGDFREQVILEQLTALISQGSLDVLLSDMAPNISGNAVVDIPRAMYLAELAFDFGDTMLKKGGVLVMKLFHGEGFDNLVKLARLKFNKVQIRKPLASRSRSREAYLLAKDYKL